MRFVQLFNGAYASGGKLNWDGHSALKEQYDTGTKALTILLTEANHKLDLANETIKQLLEQKAAKAEEQTAKAERQINDISNPGQTNPKPE